MLHHHEIPAFLLQEFPDIVNEFKYMYPSTSIYKTIECFTNYTSHGVLCNDLRHVRKCFLAAEKLYCYGDTEVTKAIEKIFLYSCPVFMDIWNKEETTQLQLLMPSHLRHAFTRIHATKLL